MTYCEKHEMSNCAECNGAAARFDASMSERVNPEYADDVLPIVPGASVIRAQYGGTCGGCGRRYYQHDVIFRSRIQDHGWEGYACCA